MSKGQDKGKDKGKEKGKPKLSTKEKQDKKKEKGKKDYQSQIFQTQSLLHMSYPKSGGTFRGEANLSADF